MPRFSLNPHLISCLCPVHIVVVVSAISSPWRPYSHPSTHPHPHPHLQRLGSSPFAYATQPPHPSLKADDSSSGGLSLSSSRATEMPNVLSRFTKADGTMDIGAFAWGGVWYHTFAAAFTHHDCRAALQAASRNGGSTVVLGSSIGFEAYFAALTFGLPTVGVELLCGLVDLSNKLRDAHAIPPQLNRFECANALTFSLPQGTALVYVDDTAWDAPTIDELGRRLVQHLPAGVVVSPARHVVSQPFYVSLRVHLNRPAPARRKPQPTQANPYMYQVIHNTEHGYTDPTAYRKLQAVSVGTSWNPAHTVHVHITV